MTIEKIIQTRGIEEIMHFTTKFGLLGIFDSKAVKPRDRLTNDQRLEFILKLNTPIVRDTEWANYVNLSITRINASLFRISSGRWHPDVWWCILSFDPIILTHDGVYFTTTNNAHHKTVRRGQGRASLEALFVPSVRWGHFNSVKTRTSNMPDSYTTCEQAEVLYPHELSTEFLRRIYVGENEEEDEVHAQIAALNHQEVPVIRDLRKFGRE
jgi:hypothetical protein